MAEPGPVLWQGAVNQWECDQMEHLNTRFYMERLEEALAGLARLLGLDTAELSVEAVNLRFLREARVGATMVLHLGVVAADGAALTLSATLVPATGGEAHAAYLLRARAPRAVTVPPDLRADAPAPGHAPRDVPFEAGAPALPDLAAGGFRRVAAGCLGPASCDAAGAMRLSHPMGRLSDGMTLVMGEPRAIVTEHADPRPARVGGATLEARFDMFEPARLGERLELWSAIAEIRGKVFRVESWLVAPETGRPVTLIRSVGLVLDLDARAAVAVTPEAASELSARGLVQRA